ncbi:22610_t:CDS:2 [Rhizophagus irregularis]|nr:22610_t:CDS:2 [Rhizophagus irregularis]
MQQINNSCLEEQQPTINLLPKFNKVNFVAAVPQINHNNVGTNETLEQVQEMHQFINRLQGILEQDIEDSFSPTNTNNLLFVHNYLLQLELSRDNTMQEACTASQDIINILRSYFIRLDKFSNYFTNYLWNLSKILMPLAKNGQASTIISSIAKIIEIEEAADERAINQNQLDSKKNEIDPVFPSNYNILTFYVLAYHRNVYKCIESILQNDPDTETILRLIGWVRHYYTFMEKNLYFYEDLMEPNLLNGKEQSLIDDYLNLVRIKFHEWKTNLIESDIKEFTQRQNSPEFDSDNFAKLPGAPILISMVRQQIDVAMKPASYQLLIDVVNECCIMMSEIQQTWINLLESELQRYLNNQEECADEIIIYIVALANDQLGYTDFIGGLLNQFTSSLPEEHIKNINNLFNNLTNGFFNVATNSINTILDIIFNDLKSPFKELHTAKWYKVDTMEVIVLTLKDYTDECNLHLKSYNFYKLMINMLNRFVIAYLESMRNKAVTFRMPHCIDKMRKDIHSISQFFGQYIGAQELTSRLDVINKLHDFLGTSKESVHLGYYSIRKSYGDVPRKYLKYILSKRNDFDPITMMKINKILKDKAAEAGEYNGERTVFSEIVIKDLEKQKPELMKDVREAFHNMQNISLRKGKKKNYLSTINNIFHNRNK